MLKEKEVTEDVHTEAAPSDYPEGAVDLVVTSIASENLMTSNGLVTTRTVSRESIDGTNQAGETEV
jgi:hypothetical protein